MNASQGSNEGSFLFYTSSSKVSKRTDKPLFFKEAIIFGNGGSANIHYSNEPFSTTSHCIVATQKEENINIKYVYYYLSGNLHLIERGFKGVGLKNISPKYIENLDIPIFPIETQNKIVSVLDKANSIISKRGRSLEILEQFIVDSFLEMFSDPVLNTKKWKLKPLSEVVHKIDAGWSPVCEETPRESSNQFAILKQSAVSKRVFDPSQNKLLPENTVIKKKILAQKNDVLFSRKNTKEMVGSTVYLFEDYEKLLLPDTIFNLRYNSNKISGVYLYFLFNDKNFQKKIQQLRSGAADSMSNISQDKLYKLQIPLPDIKLQNNFENIVLNVNAKKQKIQNSLNELNGLIGSIMQRAFNGQLNFNVDLELEALINEIDLQKKTNDIKEIAGDIAYLQRLIDKLNTQDFSEKIMYDKAKLVAFQLMNESEEKRRVSQEYDEKTKSIRLSLL
ncbi:restriction endonuclease subunit S [Flavobacterium enshiense]|uniref:restriction endonuclease subunit S n=1 Tax=Flavobacterium enshiense TaxID=1341165 RepID=UPI00345D5BF6